MENTHNQVDLEYNILSFSQNKKNKLAKEFAEGNSELEELLHYLWNKNIVSYACCGGHEIIDEDIPYIFFDIRSMSKIQLKNLLSQLFNINKSTNDTIINFSVSIDEGFNQGDRNGFSIAFMHPEIFSFSNFLKLLNIALTSTKALKYDLSLEEKQFIDIAQKMNEVCFSAFLKNAPVEFLLNNYSHPSLNFFNRKMTYTFHDIIQKDFDYQDARNTIQEMKKYATSSLKI